VKILGLDPGLGTTGWGLIQADGNRLSHIANGQLTTKTSAQLPERLASLGEQLEALIAEHRPDSAAVEEVFVNANPQSTLALGQARGTAICAAVLAGLPVAEYTALQVKQSVVGNGHAKKEQVQHMVKRLLALPGDPASDAADALACAICHAHGGRLGSISTRSFRIRRGRLV
jgi:crossover junction endodeoxyribonuclease RuvC